MESSWYLWQPCDTPALRGFGVQYRNNANYFYAFCWKSYRIFLDICDQIQEEWHKWFQNQVSWFYLCSFLTLRAENMDTQYNNSKVRRCRVLKFIPWMQLLRISDAKKQKTQHRTWEMHLQIHPLFTEASSETISVEGWLTRICLRNKTRRKGWGMPN